MQLLHLSDVHVTDPDAPVARFADGEARLAHLVDHVLRAEVPLDAVVLTGDLVDHGTPEEYARLRRLLDRLPCPWYPLPGNHDRRPAFDDALLDGAEWAPPRDGPFHYAVDLGSPDSAPLRLVMVDSTRPDRHDALWSRETVEWLDEVLDSRPNRRTIVFTHHPPVGVGLWHMDYGGGEGGTHLGEVIARHPQVEAVACGHVHRRLTMRWAGTLLRCVPLLTYGSEPLLDGGEPVLHAGAEGQVLFRDLGGHLALDTFDLHLDRPRMPMRAALGDAWPAYVEAARSGIMPRDTTGH